MVSDPLHDLDLLLRSRYGLILLETVEEERAEVLLRHLADTRKLPLFSWSATQGVVRVGEEAPARAATGAVHRGAAAYPDFTRADAARPGYETTKPLQALHHVHLAEMPALYHFRGLGAHLSDPLVARKLRDAALPFAEREGALVLTGTGVQLPDELRPLAAILALPLPGVDDYRELLRQVARDVSERMPVEFHLTREELAQLTNVLRGLTMMEAEKVLTRVIVEDGRLTPEDVRTVGEAKTEIVAREGLLEYYPAEQRMVDIAGIAGLKAWLEKRRTLIAAPEKAREFGLPFPKGVLLVGVPGCGKSLCAKAVAMEWGLPLLKLDPANLYNKYVGESERNFKRATQLAERLSPVVLWIDEIEKAFSSGDGEASGVSTRVLGGFLSWMQERRGDVFVVATANDVTSLPPELLRKGRFDEIFFVDLPDAPTRQALWEIQLRRRGRDPGLFPLSSLVDASEGFSGAEIEQAVIAALYTAFSASAELSPELLDAEVRATRPLSRTRAEEIARLREWARERTVSAHP